jgi:CDP-diacylglycerol--glycerol-3-phosphate 3-phosphatidyltransferase
MASGNPLRKSIVLLVTSLFLLQTAVLAAVFFAYSIHAHEAAIFAGINAVFHAALAFFLISRAADIRIEGAGEPLKKVNPSNVLTVARVSSIPTALFLILLSRRIQLLPVALPYLFAVFITDFFDGILARARKEVTLIGRYLDSVSDYLILASTSIVFFAFALIPAWFFVLILSRLGIFAVFMAVAALKQGKATPLATFLGKASIFATMFLYLLETAEYFSIPVIGYPLVVRVFEIVAAAVIVASFFDKAVFLRKLFSGRI